MYAYPAAQKSFPSPIFLRFLGLLLPCFLLFSVPSPFLILTQAVHIFGLIIEHNIFSAFLVGHNWRLRHESPQFPSPKGPLNRPAPPTSTSYFASSGRAFPFNEIFPCSGRVNTLNRFQFFNIPAFIGWHFFGGDGVVEINL